MFPILCSLLSSIRQVIRSRAALQVEVLALRHQLLVLHRANRDRKLSLNVADRLLWVWLSRLWSGWRSVLLIVKPETVIAWHRRGFLFYWRWKSHHPQGAAVGVAGNHRSDSQDEPSESPLGCSQDPRGTAEAGVHAIRSHRREVHGAASQAALSDLANIPRKSRERTGFF